ncbi:hypothetical protein SOVF_073580 isoform A [Spinacia oleracea]|uniref:Uncharacterized protein isoform X2 n=1 Tax=Spinacia oleracea TaxID=3562 RepID=A0A9R0IQH8_SPIOL|nr:uncharacterized protein LOC110792651 isoform X2 [Spinacia oleracea]KNA18142.1 hypothetical protein SOVF_073580 isoform A [Spinacia oleracea]
MASLKLFTSLALIGAAILSLFPPTTAAIAAEFKDSGKFEWQILSSQNFSSQIRLHPQILLFITVPWCGESRSLMNEISWKLAKEQEKYNSLKLMFVNRNLDKTLADSLGGAEGITVLCYHHAMSYKYQGILREQDILSSVNYLMSLAAEDLPLKILRDSRDLEMFLASTDKAVLLLESCGWTLKLLEEQTSNGTVQGTLFPGDLKRETNQTLAPGRQKFLKDGGKDMNCDVQHGCGESSWVGEFSAKNGTASPTNEDMQPTAGTSCSFKEYIKFKSFFSKFMALARDIYLPPQSQRYGFVSDRSLLSSLGIEDSDQWSLIISYAGCPGCLRKFKDEIHLQKALEMHDLPVMEVPDEDGKGPALPVDKPSVVLFVDRTSDSVETRKRSQKALHIFKELALQYWKSYPMDWQSSDLPKRSLHTYQGSASMFKNNRLLLSPSSQIPLKDKMSIMIINEGQQVKFGSEALNLQSGSLHEILTYLAGQKKESKLSSLAKEAGFQLLSDEIDVKVANVLSSLEEIQNQDLFIKSDVVSGESIHDKNKDLTDQVAPLVDQKQQFLPTDVEIPSDYSNLKVSINLASRKSEIMDPHQSLKDREIGSAPDVDSKMQTEAEKTENSEGFNHDFIAFTGSFFFCDGNFKFLRSLTNDSQAPRIVIIDPLSQQHYVLSEEVEYSVISVSTFINGFLNGSLTPYQRSGSLRKSIEMPQPPFVNLDFHEKDSIPIITTATFSELVLGSGESEAQDATNAWHKDVVVLFSSSWCGLCQRMELIVREVYRSLKGYRNMVESESNSKELFFQDNLKDIVSNMPAFYLIDCTLNECSWFLKSMGQKEVYPSLLLFPAERKTAIVYDGNMMVKDILNFIANRGSSSNHIARQKGNLWTNWKDTQKHDDKVRGVFTSGDAKKSSDVMSNYFGTILQNAEIQNPMIFKPDEEKHTPNPTVGSFLVATELLHESNPFNKAKILIVDADHGVGFQGLIVNKPLSWDSLPQFQDVKLLEGVPVSFGGPVMQQEMPLVSLARISFNHQYPQVLPGVYLLNQLETLGKVKEVKAGNQSATDLWFFWGYSGWSWEQLLSEIAEGVWTLHEGNNEDLQWPK